MKVKSKISSQSCPKGKWQKTSEVEVRTDLPKEIIDEVLLIWQDIKSGRAKDITTKRNMIDLHNTIYLTKYSVNTNCGNCISTCFKGIRRIYKEHSGNN
tara:strand:+ start:1945 stop:2241 length:297 start_codon:yes stop_codon:yes gene_type:complete